MSWLNKNIQEIILNTLKSNKISKDFLDFIHSNYKNKVFNTYVPDNTGISSSTIKNICGSDIKTVNEKTKISFRK